MLEAATTEIAMNPAPYADLPEASETPQDTTFLRQRITTSTTYDTGERCTSVVQVEANDPHVFQGENDTAAGVIYESGIEDGRFVQTRWSYGEGKNKSARGLAGAALDRHQKKVLDRVAARIQGMKTPNRGKQV